MGYIGKVPADVLIDPMVDSAAITDATIVTADIADNAVTSAKLAANSVDSSELIDGSIDNGHLAGSIAINKTLLAGGTGLTLSTNTLNVDAAQTQITSVGTLTSLTTSGIVSTSKIFEASGQNVSHGASRIKISQESSALSEFRFYGADTSTPGSLRFIGSSSDGSVGNTRLTIASDGNATFSGQIKASDGTAGAPSYSFSTDTDTGIYWGGTNSMGFVTGGTSRMELRSTGSLVIGAVADEGDAIITNGADGGRYDVLTVQENGNARWNLSFEGSGATNSLTLNSNSTSNVLVLDNATGNATFAGDVTIANNNQILGAADGVSYSFTGDPDTGIQSGGTNTIQITTGGSKAMDFDGSQVATFTGNLLMPTGNLLVGTDGGSENYARVINGSGNQSRIEFNCGGTYWSVGQRGNDSNKFYISNNNSLEAGVALTIDTSENANFAGAISQGGTGFNLTGSAGRIKINGTSGGDNFMYIGNYNDNGWGYIESNNNAYGLYVYTGIAGSDLVIDASGASSFHPYGDEEFDIGDSSHRFDDVYASNGTIQTSDKRMKENIKESSLGLDFINKLNPVEYKWKDYDYTKPANPEGTREEKIIKRKYKRTHYGLIAQEVEKVLTDSGLTTKDFAPIIYDEDADRYGMRYTEMIGILIKGMQELSAEFEKLKGN